MKSTVDELGIVHDVIARFDLGITANSSASNFCLHIFENTTVATSMLAVVDETSFSSSPSTSGRNEELGELLSAVLKTRLFD
jgi:hypothetical protein